MMYWVRRKHPRQPIFETTKKYILNGKTSSNHKWVWGVQREVKENSNNKLAILNISETKITKHPLLKLDKNPYLTEDRKYFESRIIEKSSAKFRELIYKRFNHLCPHCNESLHNGENIELHHIIPKKDGGKYTLENIQPLHQICHISITHNQQK